MSGSNVFQYIFFSGLLVSSIQAADLVLLDRHKKSIQKMADNLDASLQRLRLPSTSEILSSDITRIAVSAVLAALIAWAAYDYARDLISELIFQIREGDIVSIAALLSYLVFLYLGVMFVVHGGGHEFCDSLMKNVLDSSTWLAFLARFGLITVVLSVMIIILLASLILVFFIAIHLMGSVFESNASGEPFSVLGVELNPIVIASYIMFFAAWFTLFLTPFLIYFTASYAVLAPLFLVLLVNLLLSAVLALSSGMVSRIADYSGGPVAAVVIIITFCSGIIAFGFEGRY